MRTKRWIAATGLGIAFILECIIAASSLELSPDPITAGFSVDRLARISSALESDVKNRRVPGAVLMIKRHGKVAYFEAFGLQDTQSGAPMRKDSIFRIYSLTKPIISVAVMIVWEEGRFDLDDPISKYLPELKDLKVAVTKKDVDGKSIIDIQPANRQPTIQQLLTHTGGLTYDILPKSPDYPVRQMYVDAGIGNPDETLAEKIAKIGKLPLAYEPGTVWEYSRSTDVLARFVEVVSGMPIDRFLEMRIFEPLKMKDTGFWVPSEKLDRLAEPFAVDPATGNPVQLINVTKPPKFFPEITGWFQRLRTTRISCKCYSIAGISKVFAFWVPRPFNT